MRRPREWTGSRHRPRHDRAGEIQKGSNGSRVSEVKITGSQNEGGNPHPELDPYQRIHMTKRLAPRLGRPIVHYSKNLKQDLVTNAKDVGVRL